MRDTFIKILKVIALPLILAGGGILGFFGIGFYWYYWTFKPSELYNKINEDATNN